MKTKLIIWFVSACSVSDCDTCSADDVCDNSSGDKNPNSNGSSCDGETFLYKKYHISVHISNVTFVHIYSFQSCIAKNLHYLYFFYYQIYLVFFSYKHILQYQRF